MMFFFHQWKVNPLFRQEEDFCLGSRGLGRFCLLALTAAGLFCCGLCDIDQKGWWNLFVIQCRKNKNFFQSNLTCLEVISVLPGQAHSFLPVNRIVELTKITAIYQVEYSWINLEKPQLNQAFVSSEDRVNNSSEMLIEVVL